MSHNALPGEAITPVGADGTAGGGGGGLEFDPPPQWAMKTTQIPSINILVKSLPVFFIGSLPPVRGFITNTE